MTNKYLLKPIAFLIIVLAAVSCIISISENDLYQDGEWINAQWLGQDIVTLFIAIPLLYVSQNRSLIRDQVKWRIVQSGILFYFAYTYTFFVFGAQLTFLYLFHLPVFGLSVIGLFISLMDLLNPKQALESQQGLLKIIIISYLLLMSLMITFLWVSDIIAHLTVPGHISDTPTGEPLLLVYSLDLAIIIPLMIMSAVGYWKDKQYGYRLTGVMLAKTSTLGFALMGMSLSLYLQDLSLDTFLIILWCIIGIVGTTLTVLFLKQLKETDSAVVKSAYRESYSGHLL